MVPYNNKYQFPMVFYCGTSALSLAPNGELQAGVHSTGFIRLGAILTGEQIPVHESAFMLKSGARIQCMDIPVEGCSTEEDNGWKKALKKMWSALMHALFGNLAAELRELHMVFYKEDNVISLGPFPVLPGVDELIGDHIFHGMFDMRGFDILPDISFALQAHFQGKPHMYGFVHQHSAFRIGIAQERWVEDAWGDNILVPVALTLFIENNPSRRYPLELASIARATQEFLESEAGGCMLRDTYGMFYRKPERPNQDRATLARRAGLLKLIESCRDDTYTEE